MIDKQAIISQLTAVTPVVAGSGLASPFKFSLANGSYEAAVLSVDSLAATFAEIVFVPAVSPPLAIDRLPELANELSARLSYLLEPMGPIEFQSDSATLQMRSIPPSLDEQLGRSYYELLLRPVRLKLRRYRVESGKPREDSMIAVTHEIFARLAVDFSQALDHCVQP